MTKRCALVSVLRGLCRSAQTRAQRDGPSYCQGREFTDRKRQRITGETGITYGVWSTE